MNNIRMTPQLVRKRAQVITPKHVVVVHRKQTINIQDLKKPTPAKVPTALHRPAPPAPKPQKAKTPPALSAAVARNKLIKERRKKKPAEVRYVTRDINPESVNKIATQKGRGRGKLLIIVGNGPSILEAQLEDLKGHPKIELLTVNKPDQRIWPTHYWAFFDSSQFRRHEDIWNGYDGTIFNSTAIKRQKASSMQLKNHGGKGWCRDLLYGIHIGRSSVFASMQIAAWLGHEHVYVFGCDMDPGGLNGQLHFYGQNPDVKPEDRKRRFEKEASWYEHAASIMSPEERSKYTFCSSYNKWPFVDKFQKLDHRPAVDHILKHAARLL